MIRKILLVLFLLMSFASAFQNPFLLFLMVPLVAIVGLPYITVHRTVKRNA